MRRLQRGILRQATEGEPVKLDDAVIAAAKGHRSYGTSRVRTSWPVKGDVAAEVETPRTRLSAGRFVFRWGGRRDGCVWSGNFRPRRTHADHCVVSHRNRGSVPRNTMERGSPMTGFSASPFEYNDEDRLGAFALSSEILHNGLRPGASRAANRSSLALDSTPGTDVYHDGMENLHRILKPSGWRLVRVDAQPRLVHPDGIVSFTISSGINVGKANMRTPRTRKKGPATRNSLAASNFPLTLFDDVNEAARLVEAAKGAPFYFLLCERATQHGNGLILEFSEPKGMTKGGSVNQWGNRIGVPFLELEGDLSAFDRPDDDDAIDVPIVPR